MNVNWTRRLKAGVELGVFEAATAAAHSSQPGFPGLHVQLEERSETSEERRVS